jgi:hypothetical protein
MADWDKCWSEILRRVDASKCGSVRLTIDEIRANSNCHEQNLHHAWWWDVVNDSKIQGNDVRLYASGLRCQPHVENDRVVAVTFMRTRSIT